MENRVKISLNLIFSLFQVLIMILSNTYFLPYRRRKLGYTQNI